MGVFWVLYALNQSERHLPFPFKAKHICTLADCYYNGIVFHTELDSICGELITYCVWPVNPVSAHSALSSPTRKGRGFFFLFCCIIRRDFVSLWNCGGTNLVLGVEWETLSWIYQPVRHNASLCLWSPSMTHGDLVQHKVCLEECFSLLKALV